jgi:outer membrane immunogenic protein
MKRFLLTGVAVLAFAGNSALAADMMVKTAPYAPAYNWTGCYVGANGGGAWDSMSFNIGNNNSTFFGPAFAAGATPSQYNESSSGGIVGAQAGCNWQSSAWVYGLEADADWANLKNTQSIATNAPGFFPGFGTASDSMQSIATIRGRLGYAIWDRLMVYATGGVAFGNTDYNYHFSFPLSNETYLNSYSATRVGGSAGGGLEYAFGGGWSAKVEALWYDLPGTQFYAGAQTPVGPAGAAHIVTANGDSGWMLRAGVNIKVW